MQLKPLLSLSILGILLTVGSGAAAHSGRTNASGCHNNHSTGDYHCHNSGSSSSPTRQTVPTSTPAVTPYWRVLSVGDGDTLRVTTGTENATIRLGCVDSPELAQDFGESSKEYLQALLPINTPVALRTVATDRYGRTVAEIFSQGRNINLSLVESGHAVAYRQYLSQCDQDAYLEAEAIARQNRLVFWSVPNPVMPWDFRRQR
ncbi:thermonuclease family protein [Synechococcus sp. PCC 7335]|uniref:thermonuclease family protein n=1 Tax=Synechococcus sp. (strain ATCC 29403 / PCC 7335) TaxID=91464 RepID=UPI0012FBA1E2|nr:thermonuclease family protein [Synechococcus sp. PCC 7335]